MLQNPHRQFDDAHALWSTADVAAVLNVSPRHVQRLERSDAMPSAIRLGAAVRFDPDEIWAWIRAGCPHVGDQGRSLGMFPRSEHPDIPTGPRAEARTDPVNDALGCFERDPLAVDLPETPDAYMQQVE